MSISLIILFLGVFSSAKAQISPLFSRQAQQSQNPKVYTKEELKRKLAAEIILIEGDGKKDGKYYDLIEKQRITTTMTDLINGIAEAQQSSFGRALAAYLKTLLTQVREELRLLKDLYKNIDNLSEKEIDAKLTVISKQMTSIIPTTDRATKEMEGLKSKASINPFSDKADELQDNINQMMAKKAYLQKRSAELNLIIKGTIAQPPPPAKPIKDQIKEQEELFKQLLEQAKQQTSGGALVLNLFDEPGFWERWLGGGQKNKPEDEQALAKSKLINSHLQELVKNKTLTEEDIKKLEDAETLEEKIKIIVDIQERVKLPPELPISIEPTPRIIPSKINNLEQLLREKYGNEIYNRKIFASEVYYDESDRLIIKTPAEIEIAHREAQKDLIRQMPFGHERLAMEQAYQEMYGKATSIVPKPVIQLPITTPKTEKQKLKIQYYINPKDTFKYKLKLEELAKKGEIEFQAFKNVNVSPNGTVWYIKGYTSEQVKDWVEKNIINK